jgi:hypothetical protein
LVYICGFIVIFYISGDGALQGKKFAVGSPTHAAPVCAACHPRETARFLASPMGKSIGPPDPLPTGRIVHAPSGSILTAEYRNGRLVHSISERGLTAEFPISYQIGTGRRGRSFIVQIGNYLLQSPVSWYEGHGWDVSPGYEDLRLIDFDRPITDNCLFCHAGQARFSDADRRRLADATLRPISCERCHGSSEDHVRHPSPKNIVNPAKLSGASRDSICEQCHLEGETRVVNLGKTLQDFRPGDPLEQTFVTYLLKRAGQGSPAVTQVEELAESKCARSSGGKLWCGTCHDPHGQIRERRRQIREICQSCHATLSKSAHPAAQVECVTCHMPLRATSNIPHVAVTDHWIRRPNQSVETRYTGGDTVIAWREPQPQYRQRDLALAELEVGSEQRLPSMVKDSMKLLEALPPAQQNNDPDVLSNLEGVYLQSSAPEKAVALSRWAVETVPQSATFAMNFGIALKRSGDLQQAARELVRAIDLDPSLMQAYAELAVLYDNEQRPLEAQATIDHFLKWNPQSIQFRLARKR